MNYDLINDIFKSDLTINEVFKKHYGDSLIVEDGTVEWNSVQILVILKLSKTELFNEWIKLHRPDLTDEDLSTKIEEVFKHFFSDGTFKRAREIINNSEYTEIINPMQFRVHDLEKDIGSIRPNKINYQNLDTIMAVWRDFIQTDIFNDIYSLFLQSLQKDMY